jgi:ech hydrogenase subunit B
MNGPSVALQVFVTVAALLVAPLVGGFLFGLDRKLTARLQNRVGPPIVQPFYDFIKLWNKDQILANRSQLIYVYAHLGAVMASLVLLVWQQDMLVILFTLALGGISLVLGGFSVRSPYSQIGSQRELLQMLAYEPMLVLAAVGFYLLTGSFLVSAIFARGTPLVVQLPIVALSFVLVLGIKLRKSPFDIAAAGHAHQELVRGLLTEFSGRYLALIEMAHWYELVLVLGIISLFWANPLAVGIGLALLVYLAVILIDNAVARLTWTSMLKITWSWGAGLSVLNLGAIYVLSYFGLI